jgi:hypothetical protein
MTVGVILPFLREELDRADISLASLQRTANGEVIQLTVERCGLTSEPGW